MGKTSIEKERNYFYLFKNFFLIIFSYLERQDFLQRTDLRQFEIEKNLRQTTRPKF